jgi:hypothetical protein
VLRVCSAVGFTGLQEAPTIHNVNRPSVINMMKTAKYAVEQRDQSQVPEGLSLSLSRSPICRGAGEPRSEEPS